MRIGFGLFAAAFVFLSGASAAQAQTQTLEQALALAYERNPSLQAARAHLRATDEAVPLAQSGWRPSVDGTAEIGRMHQSIKNMGSADMTPRDMGITVTQPVFRGFRTVASVDSAKARVMAERASLQDAEQQLLLDAAKAYLDVVQGQAVVKLTRGNEEVLKQQLDQTQQRLDVGEVTKTDVSQSEARLNVAMASRLQAEGELDNARATFARLMGDMPGSLEQPSLVLTEPKTLEEAIEIAKNNNPAIVASTYNHDAAKSDVTAQQGSLLPEVNVVGSASRGWDQSIQMQNRQDSSAIMARVTVPLYRGGADYAKTRAARETVVQRRQELEDARLKAREGAIRAWQNLTTARAAIKAHEAGVRATEMALAGVREESKVGTRTILDILNAEQERLNAQVNLVKVQHDEALAILQVKAAVGRLTAQELKLPVRLYDAAAHSDEVDGKWIGVGSAE